MDIIRLPAGQVGSEASDCIQIQQHDDGRFSLTGSVLIQCDDWDEVESASIGAIERYDNLEAAEEVGIAWARWAGVATLHVAHSNGTAPLPDIYDEA